MQLLADRTIMGDTVHRGRPIALPDGMIAAIARINGGVLATRNIADFASCGLDLVCPWAL